MIIKPLILSLLVVASTDASKQRFKKPKTTTTTTVKPLPTPYTTNVCQGRTDGTLACVNTAAWTLCFGEETQSWQQPAPVGAKCCSDQFINTSTDECEVCANVVEKSVVCAGPAKLAVCEHHALVGIPKYCPIGQQCCQNQCVDPGHKSCLGYTLPPGFDDVKPYVKPTTSKVKPTPTPMPDVDCSNIDDYGPICVDPVKYMYCLDGDIIKNQVGNFCPVGKVCCPSQENSCVDAASCPEVPLPTTGLPAVRPEGETGFPFPEPKLLSSCPYVEGELNYCFNSTSYTRCVYGLVQANMKCAPGTVCCRSTNKCDWEYNC